ncbi:FIST signal transduction protein [Tautonia sociabilis]|uniref:Histidine kinase n=1 Tax=Tautonia sociabilis TaxID=2080755 RepID=A0A432MRG8_9BACT|nr:FIST N-terminal domain-containing protein [Tautonia sociabilis]RUL89566.1 hypothetical protein TsocGM_01995 [Tautonia sociabilis]
MATVSAALSTVADPDRACQEVLDRLEQAMGTTRADLAVAFASAEHADALGTLSHRIRQGGLADHVIGCSGETIVGEGREIESGPALALWSIRAPGAGVHTFRATGPADLDRLPIQGEGEASPSRAMILLGDPFSFSADDWLTAVNERAPGLPVVGGMASASHSPGGNRLVVDDELVSVGAVGVLLEGPIAVRAVVSQGCRPIGRPMIVTRADRNIILDLGRRPAVEVLRELLDELSPEDRARARKGLHLGRVMSEYREQFGRGDFLVRNVMGIDPRGGIAVSDLVRVGQTVQFHVRDAETADEDLHALLDPPISPSPVGALLFSCNGRGTRLFPSPDHDARVLTEHLGPVPVCGFFAMGELGPVGGRNYVHGFTASIALFQAGSS